MLNIPKKDELNLNFNKLAKSSETKVSKSKLNQLIKLRQKINQMELLINEIMPDAINEALDIVGNDSAINGKNIVYSNEDKGKITINFRKHYPSPKDNITLERLDSDIRVEKTKLCKANESKLAEIEAKLSELNAHIKLVEKEEEKLLTNQRLIALKSRYKEERENCVELVPSLSVFVNK